MLTAMTLSVTHLPNAIDSEMVALLERWALWLRAGDGFGSSVTGGYEERHDQAHEQYRDLVAEIMDKQIARLPEYHKRILIAIWYGGKSVRQMAKDNRIPRGAMEVIHGKALGWLGASLHNLTGLVPSVDNLERWIT